MLMLSSTLRNRPIISLRLGGPIATATEAIINPNNLKIIGWWCSDPQIPVGSVLLAEDVRESMPTGLAVNDEADITTQADLVRHQEILKLNFQLVEKLVKTTHHKLGKVSDFAYDETMFIQKLYVSKPLVKLFSNEDTLIIGRNQIVEVTDEYILVEDTEIKEGAAVPAGVPASTN